jgi:hypothetical protein
MKMKKLLSILLIVLIALITGCKKDDFTEIKVECPAVESTDPANGAAGVLLNQGISVTFNEDMYLGSSCETGAPFSLDGLTPVEGIVTYNGKTATFTSSSNLLPGTTYTATITKGFKNRQGIPLAENYTWSFTTVKETDASVIPGKVVHADKN